MKSNTFLGRGRALALGLAGMMAASTLVTAQTATKGPVAHFTGTAVNVTGAGNAVKIDLLRWSTDAERDQLLTALSEKGEKELIAVLQKAPTIGYLWTSESAGYSLRYAYRVTTPDGGERVVLATDHPLGSWNPQIWKPTGSAKGNDYPFAVIELRFTSKGIGEGKSSLLAKVTADKESKTIALDNFAAAPVVLKDLKRDVRSSTSG